MWTQPLFLTAFIKEAVFPLYVFSPFNKDEKLSILGLFLLPKFCSTDPRVAFVPIFLLRFDTQISVIGGP